MAIGISIVQPKEKESKSLQALRMGGFFGVSLYTLAPFSRTNPVLIRNADLLVWVLALH